MGGDDISLPERASVIAQAWEATGQRADLLACNVIDMSFAGKDLGTIQVDDLSKWRDVEDWARKRPHVIGAGHAVTRRLFERFGPLQPGVMEEDQVNTLRAVCSGGGISIRQALVRYRRGGVSSGIRQGSGQDFLHQVRPTPESPAARQRWNAPHDAHLIARLFLLICCQARASSIDSPRFGVRLRLTPTGV
jgi:hypothetical protein